MSRRSRSRYYPDPVGERQRARALKWTGLVLVAGITAYLVLLAFHAL